MATKSDGYFFFLFLFFTALIGGWLVIDHEITRGDERTESIYAGAPAKLYRTVGIRECGRDGSYYYKNTKQQAVLVDDEDLARVMPLFIEHIGAGVTAALYVSGGEKQPALVGLHKQGGTYCVLGTVKSLGTLPLLLLHEKYQYRRD